MKSPMIVIERVDGKVSRHNSHSVAAKELSKSRKAKVASLSVRERNGSLCVISSFTLDEEIYPRIAKRDVSGLIEVLELMV